MILQINHCVPKKNLPRHLSGRNGRKGRREDMVCRQESLTEMGSLLEERVTILWKDLNVSNFFKKDKITVLEK